jgi:hypothetical protein
MSEPQLPALRASDRDREQVADALRHAAGDGQLTMTELDERLDAAYGARTRAELEPLTADLQPVDGSLPASEARAAGGISVRRGAGGARWLVAIMGGCERKGRWRMSERAISLNVMGGSDLDLNDAEFASEHVELIVFSLMGGAEIRVPEGLAMEVTDFAFMGGNSADVGRHPPSRGGPVLHLRMYSIMGGVNVSRGRRRSRAERKAMEQQERHRLGH